MYPKPPRGKWFKAAIFFAVAAFLTACYFVYLVLTKLK